MNLLSPSRLAVRSLLFFAKSHLSVGLGIAAATAVIVGALVVGDSVRASLRRIVVDRLANVECLLHSPNFFQPTLVADLQHVQPLIFLPLCSVEHRTDEKVHRSSQIQIFGTNTQFWANIAPPATHLPAAGLQPDEVAISHSLAAELQAEVGDELTLRFDRTSGVPADSPLGHRDDMTINLPRQKIVAILPDVGVGGLSFASSQTVPRNVFCHVATLQDSLDCNTRVNAALALTPHDSDPVTRPSTPPLSAEDWCEQLNSRLRPTLEDYGLSLERVTQLFPEALTDASSSEAGGQANSQANDSTRTEPSTTIYDYYQLSSRELIIDNAIYRAVAEHFDGQETHLLAYLSNTITKIVFEHPEELDPNRRIPQFDSPAGGPNARGTRVSPLTAAATVVSRPVPYSIVLGLEDPEGKVLAAFTTVTSQQIRFPYCWINSWLAEQLDAAPQDWLELTYFEPETIDGHERLHKARMMVAGIVPFTEPVQGFRRDRPPVYSSAPTIFNDPQFTPTVPGLTDKDSIANWDAPFPLDLELLKAADDEYYENHRLTPKLFLPYNTATATNMFGSRFGQTTSIRFAVDQYPDEGNLREQLAAALLEIRGDKGFRFIPIRRQLLQSAAGTTPFDMLFLSLSFFVIVAALMLVALLFKLGISQRVSQLGLLSALGFTAARIRGLLMRELSLVALGGALFGVALGMGYAWAMIAALESWWVGAISAPFLNFSFTPLSLGIGASAGLLMSLCTIYFALRRSSGRTPLNLLRSGPAESDSQESSHRSLKIQRGLLSMAGFVAIAAIGLLLAGIGQNGMARAGSFFGCGMLLLFAGLIAIHTLLRSRSGVDSTAPPTPSLPALAWRTVGRNPLRSSLALGLLSVASFLIASMSVFQVSPDPRGYGGFNLIAESSQPIYRNLASNSVRIEQLGPEAAPLADTLILPLRMKPGQDASCNNLFQVSQPTILGIPNRLEQLGDFSREVADFQWAAKPVDNWKSLEPYGQGSADNPIPVILDQNTAAWSLKQGASIGALIVLQYGERELHFKTVGLLANSVLQGKLLIGESNFKQLFPELSGYRFFLIHSGDKAFESDVAAALEKGWSEAGLDVTVSRETLERLLGVQNTYIRAFQSLGALGLLLGSFGLIAVQLRSVWERRRELALMQAVGFSKTRIAHMLTLETAILLGGGLILGSLAALIALLPYVIENDTRLGLLGPLAMLAGVLLVGFTVAIVAVRAAMKKSVLSGLRSE